MTINEFIEDWSPGLDRYIRDLCCRYARRPEDREDLKSEAYLYLSLARHGLTDDELRRVARNAIQNLVRAYRREEHITFDQYFEFMNRWRN